MAETNVNARLVQKFQVRTSCRTVHAEAFSLTVALRLSGGGRTFETRRNVRLSPSWHPDRISPDDGLPLETRHPFGNKIAGQKADPEQQHETGGGKFDAAHDERAAAVAGATDAAGDAFCRDGQHRDGRNRNEGTEAHNEGGGNAGPEQ